MAGMNSQIPVLGACFILLASCSGLWNAANRSSLETDVAQVLSIDPAEVSMQCAMVDTTRTGYCVLPADETQVDAWARSLGLSPRRASLSDGESVPPLASEGPVGCLDAGRSGAVEGQPAYWIGARPTSLALGSGGQFEYLLLIFDPAAAQACVQVSYAYG